MKKWLSLENLIYVSIIFLPVYLVRFSFFGVPTNLWEVLTGAILVIWLWKRGKESGIRKTWRQIFTGIDKRYVGAVGLIFLGLLFSLLVNKNYLVGLGIFKGWFLFPLVFFLLARDVLGRKKALNAYKAVYFSALGVAIFSLVFLISGHLTFDGRLRAFFNSPNYLAMYLAPGIITGVVLLQFQNFKKKILILLSLTVMVIPFYFTYSYAAWFSAMVSLMIFCLLKKLFFSKKIILLGIIFAGILILFQHKSVKFNDAINLKERSSLASRAMIWKSAGRMLGEEWTFGIGPGNFQQKYLEYQKYYPPYLEWAVPHPHSVYLAFWLYGGFMGIVGFLWLLILFFGDLARIKKEPDFEVRSLKILYISLGIMAYFLIHGLVDTTYFKNDLAVMFWLCFLAL